MQFTYDFKTDSSDDLILNGDLGEEYDVGVNVIKNIERRISARYDDFILSNIGAGIERFIGKKVDDLTRFVLTTEISRVIASDQLLTTSEYSIVIPQINDIRKIPIIIQFKSSYLSSAESDGFKVVVNIENQRSYK